MGSIMEDMNEKIESITLIQVIEAMTAIVELHERTPGNNCGECFVPYPCRTIDTMTKIFG